VLVSTVSAKDFKRGTFSIKLVEHHKTVWPEPPDWIRVWIPRSDGDLFRNMHYAIDAIDVDLFLNPTSLDSERKLAPTDREAKMEFNDRNLSEQQQKIVRSVLHEHVVRLPTIVDGPFGTGKSRTLCELAAQLAQLVARTSQNSKQPRVLFCFHSNSAAEKFIMQFDEK